MDTTPDDALTRGVAAGRRALQKMMEGEPEARPRRFTQKAYLELVAPDVAEARARGFSDREIARWLNISRETARTLDLGLEELSVSERAVHRGCSDTAKVAASASLKARKEPGRKPGAARGRPVGDLPSAKLDTAVRDVVGDHGQISTTTMDPNPRGVATSGSLGSQTRTDTDLGGTAAEPSPGRNWPEGTATANHARMAGLQAFAGKFAEARIEEMAQHGRQAGPTADGRRDAASARGDAAAELPF